MSHETNTKLYEQLQEWLHEVGASAGDIIQDKQGWYVNSYTEQEDPTVSHFEKLYLPNNFQELV